MSIYEKTLNALATTEIRGRFRTLYGVQDGLQERQLKRYSQVIRA